MGYLHRHTGILLLLIISLLIVSCGSARKTTGTGRKSTTPKTVAAESRKNKKDFRRLKDQYSGMMNVSPSDIGHYELYAFIDQWYGTRHKYGGTGKNGIDCSAMMQKLYDQVYGVRLLRSSAEQFGMIRKLNPKKLREGDLVFFRHNKGKKINHVGLYLHNDYFFHVSTSKGAMISNLKESYWKRTFVGGGRILR